MCNSYLFSLPKLVGITDPQLLSVYEATQGSELYKITTSIRKVYKECSAIEQIHRKHKKKDRRAK